jgi:dynein heavy chain, axonemal
MEDLQRIVEGIEPFRTAKDFRMWLTTMSTPDFPQAVLQASVKLTSEPPVSLKQNVRNIYKLKDDAALTTSPHPGTYRRLLFGKEYNDEPVLSASWQCFVFVCGEQD